MSPESSPACLRLTREVAYASLLKARRAPLHAGFAQWLRARDTVGVTDTTFRDAHQSLLATRVRSKDIVAVRAPKSA